MGCEHRALNNPVAASLLALSIGGGLALTIPACSGGPDSGSAKNALTAGSGSGSSCGIVNLANANLGNGACGSNSLGGTAFGSSCNGNGGSPEEWCADFAKWVWGNNGVDTGGLTPQAESFYAYGMTHGTLSNTPHVGDVIVFKRGSLIGHVAIVTQVNSNGTIESVSGNSGQAASTSRVMLNAPAYGSQVGSTMQGMTIAGYVSPYGMNTAAAQDCGFDAGPSDTGAPTDGSGEGGNSDAGSGEGGPSEGGVNEGGASDGPTSEAGYAFLARENHPRRTTIPLEPGVVDRLTFAWRAATGTAAPADLWIEAGGHVALQVYSVADSPFARTGLDVVRLHPGEAYRIAFVTREDETTLTLIDSNEQPVIRTSIAGASAADVVLPSTPFRSAVIVTPRAIPSDGSGGPPTVTEPATDCGRLSPPANCTVPLAPSPPRP